MGLNKVRFTLRNPSEKESLIVLTANVGIVKIKNGKRIYPAFKYSTGLTVPTKYWNPKKYRVKSTDKYPEATLINKKLNSIEYHFKQAYHTVNNKYLVTAERLKHQLNINLDKLAVQSDFFGALDQYIIDTKTGKRLNKGKRFSYNTYKNYYTLRKHLYDFDPYLKFSDIDMTFYNRLLNYFYRVNLSTNAIGAMIRMLKAFMNYTYEIHHNDCHRHKDFVTVSELTGKIYLREPEIDVLSAVDLSDKPRLERVRDVFLIGCNTALRYSDWYGIRKEHVFIENGRPYLKIGSTFKTGAGVIIPLNSIVTKVLQKYDYKLRYISNQKFNDYIKEACQGIKEFQKTDEVVITRAGEVTRKYVPRWSLISTHTARRSAATNMYLAGIDKHAIMKITGHKKEVHFMRYIRVSELENAYRLADNPFFKK